MPKKVKLLASGRWPYQYLFFHFQVVLFNSKSRRSSQAMPIASPHAPTRLCHHKTKAIDPFLGQGIETLEISTIFLFCRSPMIRCAFQNPSLCPWEMEAAVSLGCGKSGPPFSIAKQSLLCYRGKGLQFSRYSVIDAVGLSVGSSPLFDRVSMCESLVRERLCGNAKAYRPSSSFVG